VKFLASVIYTVLLLAWMALLALLASILFFGTNDILIARNDVMEQIQKADILWRYIAAFGFAAVALVLSHLHFYYQFSQKILLARS